MKTKFMFLALAALSACSEAFPTSELAYPETAESCVKADTLTFNRGLFTKRVVNRPPSSVVILNNSCVYLSGRIVGNLEKLKNSRFF